MIGLQDQFIQKWSKYSFKSSKGTLYRIFKINFDLETYLEKLPIKHFSDVFLKISFN